MNHSARAENNPIALYTTMNHNVNDETAQDLFVRSHAYVLKEAQNWLKRTSESWLVIALLIATVAFTAAYTVLGDSNQTTGIPMLLHYPFFVVFTFTDVLSLVSSLTSVVMFISILTSPFRLQDFRKSLPRKLTLAFTFLCCDDAGFLGHCDPHNSHEGAVDYDPCLCRGLYSGNRLRFAAILSILGVHGHSKVLSESHTQGSSLEFCSKVV